MTSMYEEYHTFRAHMLDWKNTQTIKKRVHTKTLAVLPSSRNLIKKY